jgi:DNA repair protein RadC
MIVQAAKGSTWPAPSHTLGHALAAPAIAPLRAAPRGRSSPSSHTAKASPIVSVPIAGETRTCLSLTDPTAPNRIVIDDAGPVLSATEWAHLCDAVVAHCMDARILTISGSLPPGVSPHDLASLITRIPARCRVLLDTSGAPLRACLTTPLALIKVNAHEFCDAYGENLSTISALIAAARTICQRGPQAVVITQGAAGALAITADSAWHIDAHLSMPSAPSAAVTAHSQASPKCLVMAGHSLTPCARVWHVATANALVPHAGVFDVRTYQHFFGYTPHHPYHLTRSTTILLTLVPANFGMDRTFLPLANGIQAGFATRRSQCTPSLTTPKHASSHTVLNRSAMPKLCHSSWVPPHDDAHANQLLSDAGSWLGLQRLSVACSFQQKPGIGVARAVRLKAALDMPRRIAQSDLCSRPDPRPTRRRPADAHTRSSHLGQSALCALSVLDTKNRVQVIQTLYVGSLNSSLLRSAKSTKKPFGATVRPSSSCTTILREDPNPSADDIQVTRDIMAAGKLLDVDFLDHLIIGHGQWVSMRERGLGFINSICHHQGVLLCTPHTKKPVNSATR